MKLPKLNQSGIAHILAPLLFIVVFAGIGGYILMQSKAATVTDSGGAAPTRIWKFTTIDTSSSDSGASSPASTSVSSGAAQRALAATPARPRCGPLKVVFLYGFQESPVSPVITSVLDATVKPWVKVDSFLNILQIRNSSGWSKNIGQNAPALTFLGFYDIGFLFEIPVSAAPTGEHFTFQLDVRGVGPAAGCHNQALVHGVIIEEPL